MSFYTLPPEINSLRMLIGAGSAPMLEAAAAWEGLAEELGSAAQSFLSVTTGLAGQAWQGAASAAMSAAAAPYAAWLSAAAAQSSAAGGQASALASMFEAARAATIMPTAIDANRNAFVQLVMSNLFGQNAGLIAMAESIYEEMWAADVAAMSGYYSGASSVAAQMVPWANLLQKLPSLASGAAGALGAGGGFAGAPAGSGVAGGASGGGANGGNENVGSGANTSAGSGSPGATGGGAGYVGGAGYANTVGGGTADTGLAQGDPNLAAGNGGNSVVGGATTAHAATGVGSAGMGVMPVPIPLGNSSGGVPRAPLLADNPAPPAPPPETPEPATPEEVAPSPPEMGVLPTASPEIAAKGAPAFKPQVAQTTGAGIPASKLRAGASKQDQQDSENAAEAAETPAPLRPESATGELRPRAEEPPRVQMRGG